MDDISNEKDSLILDLNEVESWAKKHGYEMSPRRRARRNIFQAIGEMGSKGKTVNQPQPQPTSTTTTTTVPQGPLGVDLRQMTFKKGLKGDHDKKVVLVEVQGKEFVLKGAEGTPKDHIESSKFIQGLKLTGIKVPEVRLVDGSEKTDIIQSLMQGSHDEQDLGRALQKGSGQLSELGEGKALDSIYLSKNESAGRAHAITVREQVDKDWVDTDKAWKDVCAALVKAMANTSIIKPKDYATWLDTTDPNVRKQALDWWNQNLHQPRQTELVKFLGEINEGKDLKKALETAQKELDEREKAMKPLKDFAQSSRGIEAFAGVAVSDLLTGMDDRMLTKWNGGNFLFDEKSQSLCCIDNIKDTNRGINAPNETSWTFFFTSNTDDGNLPLEQVLYDKVYGDQRVDEQSPGGYAELDDDKQAEAKAIFRKVLEDVVAKVESDPNAHPRMAQRAAFIKARLVIDDVARVPSHLVTPPTLPPKLDVGQKISRGLGSIFTSNKKDKRNDTKKIKEDLRSGKITAAQARTQLEALVNDKQAVGNDRRAAKIRFLAGLTEVVELLDERSAALASMARLNPPQEVWSTLGPRTGQLRQLAIDWDAVATKEGKIKAELVRAWNSLPDEVRNGT